MHQATKHQHHHPMVAPAAAPPGRDDSGYESSCSSFTAPDSRRSWISDASFGSSSSVSFRSYCGEGTASRVVAAAGRKPHKANQAEWEAIRRVRAAFGHVGLDHFQLVRRLGSGDLGNVYLCQLRNARWSSSAASAGYSPYYAMKVVDKDALAFRKKLQRAETEKEILRTLDHPFLPTLYADFDADHYSCLVMEFCPGGDLHVLRQRQPGRRFTIASAKFYAAETLLALEYLHMMGVVYRDLKPENVLVRDDGHVMLSDFDLSFKCDVVPKLLMQRHDASKLASSKHVKGSTSSSSYCVPPMQPVFSCFYGSASKRQASKGSTTKGGDEDDVDEPAELDPELVAEPIAARSKSFVGTHEYLAPEVISGGGHGSAVDWWALGVFLYEMIYGRTPFKGEDNEKTLVNIIKQPLSFPRASSTAATSGKELEELLRAQDLMGKLLAKNPKKRIGSTKGSAEIKRHEFFKGVNWALIRSVKPPEVPRDARRAAAAAAATAKVGSKATPATVRVRSKERHEAFRITQHFDYF